MADRTQNDAPVEKDGPGVSETAVDPRDEKEARKAEKTFLRKLDCCLITYVWISYCIRLIDSSNYKAAYVSGMKEDLSLYGNELNYFDTAFKVGYAVCVIPSQILLLYFRPSLYLPALELTWGILTALQAAVKSYEPMIALRFLIGVCEASAYPGFITVLMSWYTPKELSTRVAFFGTSYPAAMIFVGSLQAALSRSHGSLAGWRWLFILNGLMTIVVAIFGFLAIPDNPQDTRAWWLTRSQRDLARQRMEGAKRSVVVNFSWRVTKVVFQHWPLWAFLVAYATWSWSQDPIAWYTVYLKSLVDSAGEQRFSTAQINLIPIPAYVLQMLSMVLMAWVSDRTQRRALCASITTLPAVAGNIVLAVWPGAFVGQMVVWHIMFLGYGGGSILMTWIAEICSESAEERAIIVGVLCTIVVAMDAWLNLVLFPTSKAPLWRVGYGVSAAFGAISIVGTIWIHRKIKRSRIIE